jgi:hypothetical protein
MRHPDFAAGRLSTDFVERLGGDLAPRPDPAARRAAVVAAALHAYRRASQPPSSAPAAGLSPWALAGRPGVPRVAR